MDVQSLIEKAGGTVELANLLGVARTTVLDWKRDGLIPGSRLVQICAVLDVSPKELFPIVQPPRQSKPNGTVSAPEAAG
jgi:DNA-binding Xre family transcriptional regulator